MAFHRFCQAILQHEALPLFGDGTQTRDFTYISDIVTANVAAASMENAVGQVMNIAGGSRVNLHQVFELLHEISALPVLTTILPAQHGDVRHTYADTSLAQKCIAYAPRVSLREGLAHEFEDIAALYAHKSAAGALSPVGIVGTAHTCPVF
jgi:UDP-glucose 4-epimerase